MTKKYIFLALLVMVAIFAISQVSAVDSNFTDIMDVEDETPIDDTQEDVEIDLISTDEENDVLSTTYSPENYSDLKECIGKANDGDTINLNGTYFFEDEIAITKSINIIGSDKATITVDSFSTYYGR